MNYPMIGRGVLRCMLVWLAVLSGAGSGRAQEMTAGVVQSPSGELVVRVSLTARGELRYAVARAGQAVLGESRLGVVRDDADFSSGLRMLEQTKTRKVSDNYELLTAKRRVNEYRANQTIFRVAAKSGERMDVIFQVSNDGVAFRYFFPAANGKKAGEGEKRTITEEVTTFKFSTEARAWLQAMSVAKTGWKETNPSYEEYYQKEIPVGTASPLGAGWVYPALFRTGETWVLLSETGLGRGYAGTRLRSESRDGEYAVGFPDGRERFQGGAVKPESVLPWTTPWRVIVIGDLATVTESMLGVDLADKPKVMTAEVKAEIVPGKAAWSWPLLGDKETNFEVQKRFIDYAAEMTWRYCLIDALWDTQIGYERVKELVDYAATKGVKVLLWYNSGGDWNGAPQTPRDRMLTRESRAEEFARLKAMGVAGMKIDFFGGDGQSQIEYYLDILEEAAPFGFLINFHGCTLPRGWQRTYPHLMTMESIRGLEFITFEQANADQGPTHAAMLPFTRNVFDPMDFTPVVLDRINKIERRTSSAFELALSVLFTSGIQHYAEIPEGMAKAPEYVRAFLRKVPSVWDEVKFVDGYPGKFVVMARQGEGRWYVAGINAEATEKRVELDLSRLKLGRSAKGVLIEDGAEGGNLSFARREVSVKRGEKVEVTIKPNGGFVIVLE
ncbi:alpha-glucosidase [Nibricoccus aquaticus]|uniref:Alpha-glucosidase n=1 Tax=Nibricoccus aquaticus TaxID=2576891 RepID=A0A290QN40_9BACT|nr:glycoside hydrolase family 97 protein [Nibricoccus aquaticus]ATC66131.1 alpha-glucosidase [Nibricoccus aquaticus]